MTQERPVAPATGAVPTAPVALGPGHFRRIAVNGFGDGGNSYAWSCAWYNGAVYIGTIRHIMATMRSRTPGDFSTMQMPVPVPETVKGLDVRGQVWRYDLQACRWDRVYRSPWAKGLEGHEVPLAYGFRNMSVFQGKSDPHPVLYSIPSCGKFGVGPVLLRSADGHTFEVAGEQGLGVGDPNIISFRGNRVFKGKLFISPSGSRGGHCNTSFNAVLLCSDDPASGRWQVSNPPGFGDPTNDGIFDIGVCGEYLYAGTINVRRGAQLWKTDGEGPPPHRWTKVFDMGFDRGPHNQAIVSFAPLRGDMFLGTAIQHGGFDRHNNIGPAAAEIIRVYPDDTWDLIVGEPRMTRHGLKIPTSGYGPGFDNPFTGYIWRMTNHDDVIYIGTYNASSLLPYADPGRWPEWTRRVVDPETLESFMSVRAGAELWRTSDGNRWVSVTRNGFGNRYNWGIRALLSTPRGLFVGTANPFGPKVAVRGVDGWRYEDNPRGGLEIWHGAPEHIGRDAPEEIFAASVPRFDEVSAPYEILASRMDVGGPSSTPLPPAGGEGAADLFDRLLDTSLTGHDASHQDAGGDSSKDPLEELATTDKDLVGLTEDLDDELLAYFGGSLRCVGFWASKNDTPRRACERLVEELLTLAPPPQGGSPPPGFLVIGLSCAEVERVIHKGWPGAQVLAADVETSSPGSVRLGAADASSDIVLWVEGPGVFGRAAALRDTVRVLRPGGMLLAADLVGVPAAELDATIMRPKACSDAATCCAQDLQRAGLVDARVHEVTSLTWTRFHRHSREFFSTKLMLQQVHREFYRSILDALPGGGVAVEAYLILAATRAREP